MGKLGSLFHCLSCRKNNAAAYTHGDVNRNGVVVGNRSAPGGGNLRTSHNGHPRSNKRVTINENGIPHHPRSQSPQSDMLSDRDWATGSQASGRSSVYFDASEGNADEWHDTLDCGSFDSTLQIDGQYFFNAKDDPTLTAEAFEGIKMYPPLPTTEVDRVPRSPITMSNTDTLLHRYQHEGEGDDSMRRGEEANMAADKAGIALEHQARRMTLKASKEITTEYLGESTNLLLKELNTSNVREKGFPGELTEEELEAVKKFREELQNRDPVYRQIVHALSSVEKEAYALCRFLRARKFDVEKVFELLDDARPHYAKAKESDFFPDLEKVLGFGRPIFLSQYPAVFSGNAKNGCPVLYMKCGSIQPEGIKCIITVDKLDRYFWNDSMHNFPKVLKEGRKLNPNFVRTENVTVYDLKGVSRSQITSDTFEVIKVGNQVMSSFPETLHCLLIINAPSWFGLIWSVVKKLIDPRTASKIEVFTSTKNGDKRMRELIDESQLPSEYGGGGPSLAESASSSSGARSKMVVLNQLMFLTKKKSEMSHDFQLEMGQSMTLAVYTRCKTGATAELSRADNKALTTKIDIVGDNDDEPYSRTVGALVGPGSFTIKLSLMSEPGVFLVLGSTFESGSFSVRQLQT
eukprot:CAMPEP_0172531302 /NCGR_PEP_ID=MMETSP1067-20121228/4765_1 /TAXON_ID=265564 ORGANISM="Thalassiosira punctigera, Strain Tpunct2005C2" /NCGR_SAMPLE_ID=MMETSP1067 /ASSEMBLY_ACC=CAM_ASM_000444 /LENGTH=632 /DNA_ID=CAMNT_0013315667 /DNA_START=193 /DNA_END=2091 /DNA_ORIENTATION=+